MEKYDFTMQHLYGEDHHHITKILQILQATSLEETFIRKFYATIPMLDLKEADYKLYAQLVKNAFGFLNKHNANTSKIRIYNGFANGEDIDHTVIEILSNEMPFLFDSTICLLNRLHIEVERVAHPNVFVRRDAKGNLLAIDDSLHSDGQQELIIQIRTLHALDQNLIQKLELELQNIISLVTAAVEDWRSIVLQLQAYTDNFAQYSKIHDEHYHEQKEFLERMKDKYFVFLGSATYDINSKQETQRETQLITASVHGILKSDLMRCLPLIESTIFTSNFFASSDNLISIGKLNKASVIHRDANLDYLCLIEKDANGEMKKATIFIGLFTSILYYQSATLIPIIRGKLRNVLKQAGFTANSHTGKELVSIIEALPRDELFQISANELFPLLMEVYALLFSPELRLFLRKQGESLSCLLFLPLELANSANVRKLKSALAFEYGPIVNHYFSKINDSKLCYYHFMIDSKVRNFDLVQVENELRALTKPWDENLYTLLFKEFGKNKGRAIFNEFHQAFPISYKESTSYSNVILEDIENSLASIQEQKIIFKVNSNVEGQTNIAHFKIYHSEELNLSTIMPILQNMGFDVIAEQIYVIKPNTRPVWLHQFILKVNNDELAMLSTAKQNIEEAFYAIWQEKCQNDPYNQLILRANLSHRQVTLLRAFAEYLYQVKIGYSKEYIGQVLNKHFDIIKQLIILFYSKFDPNLSTEGRQQQITEVQTILEKSLASIHDNIEDQIIRRFIDLVNNILRTNYFILDIIGQFKDFISLKINSSEIVGIPLPRPYKEIFVYSANFEAIHLRGGKVARGGIRWSDRLEDYRTEVLGLMKTQIVKNSVIVPTGAKGGFILKNIAGLDREALQNKAIECYKNFLRGLLDITDNIVERKTQHPKHVVRYDEADSYLVVAADKGTASFSDIANQIAAEYNYWLGDAFASGGSKGYDHKKMGITARGAWISVLRHFHELNIDIEKHDFTVVGIGDMSGDVFGNGMLLSQHIQLVAAFNHMHIFVDPNPDSHTSFLERQRLFNLPRSTWKDYNPDILSKGAQIYDRKAKSLHLTPEIKARFKLDIDTISPNELIKILLTAKVDLLWNGGIGTYVKASFETHEQVGDKTNDSLRCNGADLRCRIVGEGGNLGFTQYGRIEYARNGGRLNTDAIDNSAGVDCSDHEVNIKIALREAIAQQLISEEERIILLEAMTEDVAELVLKDNRTQTRALTIAQQQGYDILSSQEHFIDLLEESGALDRELECLPSKQQFIQLHNNKMALTRPELSVLLAYSKNAIYKKLIATNLAEEEYFYNDLLLYFPETMRMRFAEILANHPLRKEIITTAITNSMVNRIATFYLHLTVEATGHTFSDIARAYTVTRDLFDLRDLWKEINTLDGVIPVNEQVKLYIVIKKFVMRSTSWLLRNYRGKIDIASTINEYRDKINELNLIINDCAVGKFKDNYTNELKQFIDKEVPESLAKKIAILNLLSSAYNIAEVSNCQKIAVKKAAELYFELGQRFSLDWLRNSANQLLADNSWQKLAIHGFKEELSDLHRRITASAVEYIDKNHGTLDQWYQQNEKHIRLYDRFITAVKEQNNIEYAMIDLSLKKLSLLLSK